MRSLLSIIAISLLSGCGGSGFEASSSMQEPDSDGSAGSMAGGSAGQVGVGGSDAGTGGAAGGSPDAGGDDVGSAGMGGTAGAGGAAGGSAGTGGAGGTAGSGGTGTGGTGGSAGCPAGMASVPPGYCIDATEVTRGAYAAWLATSPSTTGQPSECSWNVDYTPTCGWPPAGGEQHPVVCVDFCDAKAYCAGIGKRLCGKIGGGDNAYSDFADASKSQWFNACSAGGTLAYPYGSGYQPSSCNGNDKGIGSTTLVGNLASCQGGYPGIFDMSGNVWEWEDSYDGAGKCRVRGGSFASNVISYMLCGYDNPVAIAIKDPTIGFRCCS